MADICTMETSEGAGSRAFLYWTAAIAGLGAAITILASIYTRPESLLFDENYYYPLAEGIIRGTFKDTYVIRPPLYPLFLAGIFKIFGVGFRPALVVTSLLRGALIAGVALLGRRYVSRLAGLIAACIIAIYPMLIFTYTRFVSEVLYIPLFVLSFWYLERAARSGEARDSLIAGVWSGLATLVRSTSLFFTVLMSAWLIARKGKAGRFSRRNFISAGVLAGATLAVISPWTLRNAVVHKALILVDNTSAYNLWLITSNMPYKEATQEWESWGSQAERQKQGYKRWFDYVREDPAFHLKRMGTVLPKLFSPASQPDVYSLSMIKHGTTATENVALRRTLQILTPVLFWLVTAGGILGLVLLERDPTRRSLFLLTLAYFILLHAATLARPRFLLPLNTLLAVYAGGLIAAGLSRSGLTRRGRPWRR
jgi:4-amino-4-deoxy-L-arabinose transferase-like glycosyltransferase